MALAKPAINEGLRLLAIGGQMGTTDEIPFPVLVEAIKRKIIDDPALIKELAAVLAPHLTASVRPT